MLTRTYRFALLLLAGQLGQSESLAGTGHHGYPQRAGLPAWSLHWEPKPQSFQPSRLEQSFFDWLGQHLQRGERELTGGLLSQGLLFEGRSRSLYLSEALRLDRPDRFWRRIGLGRGERPWAWNRFRCVLELDQQGPGITLRGGLQYQFEPGFRLPAGRAYAFWESL